MFGFAGFDQRHGGVDGLANLCKLGGQASAYQNKPLTRRARRAADVVQTAGIGGQQALLQGLVYHVGQRAAIGRESGGDGHQHDIARRVSGVGGAQREEFKVHNRRLFGVGMEAKPHPSQDESYG